MKKFIFFVLLLLAAGLYFLPAPLLKYGIETGTKQAFGTDTSVKAMKVDLLAERMDIDGFAVDNPIGYDIERFMQLESGHALVSLESLIEDTVDVREISVTGMNLYLEQKGSRANFKEILEEMAKRNLGRQATAVGHAADSDQGLLSKLHLPDLHSTRFVVRQLHIGEGKVHIKTAAGEAKSKPLPAITLTDVGADSGGVTLAELSNIVTRAMVDSATGVARFDSMSTRMAEQTDSLMQKLNASAGSAWRKTNDYWDPIGEKMQDKFQSWGDSLGNKYDDLKEQTVETGNSLLGRNASEEPAPQTMPASAPMQPEPLAAAEPPMLLPVPMAPAAQQPIPAAPMPVQQEAAQPEMAQTQEHRFRPQAPVETQTQPRPASQPRAPAYQQPYGQQPYYGQGQPYYQRPMQGYPQQYSGYPRQ